MEKVQIIAKRPTYMHRRTPSDYAVLFDETGNAYGMTLNALKALNESTLERDTTLLGERIYLHRHYAMVTCGDSYYDCRLGKCVKSIYFQIPRSVKPTEAQISAIINEMKSAKEACKAAGIVAYFIFDWVGDYGFSISMNASGSQLNEVIKKMKAAIETFEYKSGIESDLFTIIEETSDKR